MPKALLIYNPVSGRGRTLNSLDHIIEHFGNKGITTIPLQTPYKEETLLSMLEENSFRYVFVAGGDGTINVVLNSLLKHEPLPLLGIIPAGTANNFANNLGLYPPNLEIKGSSLNGSLSVDVGRVGSRHFITAALGGHLIGRWHNADQKLKNNLGMLAYYLRGIVDVPRFKTVEIAVSSSGKEIFQAEVYLFLIFNGRDAGNYTCLAPDASFTDGLLDCIFFKKCSPADFLNLLFKVMMGNHIQDDNVLYLKVENLHINGPAGVVTDLDGEKGPPLPWQVNVLPGKLKVFKSVGLDDLI